MAVCTEEAASFLRERLTCAERAFGAGSLEVADAHNDLAYHFLQKRPREPDAAIRHLEAAIAIRRTQSHGDDPELAAYLDNLGQAHGGARAVPYHREALDIRMRLFGPRHDRTLVSMAELGVALLLFLVGLKLDWRLVRTLGPVALATGLGQVAFTAGVGYPIGGGRSGRR